ncbi:hypothetical protein [Cohnella ginsengisoli]|uniref:hypothetical protein n=1 Tax=Cohnella ginsengisoli TaxID=425004 RepID=UPI0030B88D03
MYGSNESSFQVEGRQLSLRTDTRYPWDGSIQVRVQVDEPADWTLSFRMPAWCRQPGIRVNGELAALDAVVTRGYARIRRTWMDGDEIQLHFPMAVERIESNPKVHENAGKVALQYGPIVYCLEEADNGADLTDICLAQDAEFVPEYREDVLGGVVVLTGEGQRSDDSWRGELYRPVSRGKNSVRITAIPYAYWGESAARRDDGLDSGEVR